MKAKKARKTLLYPIHSIGDLAYRAKLDPQYKKLAMISASNLGGDAKDLTESINWLSQTALEISEAGVVEEINFCRDLV